MKDKELREILSIGENCSILKRVQKVEMQTYRCRDLENISLKDCPKCKHRVLANQIMFIPETYQCLTCGSSFTCTEKCVCELVE